MSDFSGVQDDHAPRSSATWMLSLVTLVFFVLFVAVVIGGVLVAAGIWDRGSHGFLP